MNEDYAAPRLRPMTMNRVLSLALLAGGTGLIVYCVNASGAIGADLSRFFTVSPTQGTIWLLLGGVIAAVAGAGGLACDKASLF